MRRYRPAQAVTALVYGTYGTLFVVQPPFLFGTVTLELLLTASTILGGLFGVTALLATYVAITGSRRVLPFARAFEGSTAVGMAAIYLYACLVFGWGAILGLLVWLQVGATAILWTPSYADEVEQVKAMLDDVEEAQSVLAEVQWNRIRGQ